MSFVGIIIQLITKSYLVFSIGVGMIVISMVSLWTFIRKIRPSSVTFGELKTFRDLVECVAEE